MSEIAFAVALFTGCLIWAAVLMLLILLAILFGVPAFWRWVCWCGYCAFADAEEKRAVRRRAVRAAEGHPQ